MLDKNSILKKLRAVNRLRQKDSFNINPDTWEGLLHNGVGLSEEAGEVCGIIKKAHRKKRMISKKKGRKYRDKKTKDIGEEIADVIIYLDLIATHFNIDIEQEIIDKFNQVSTEINSNYKL